MTDPYDLPCQVFVEMVTDYLEGVLAADDVARLEAHLTECPPCVDVLAQWRTTIEMLGQLGEHDVEVLDPTTRASLMHAFREMHPGE